MEKAPSLKIMCEKVLGKKIYKYEQCSYLENRPLKKSININIKKPFIYFI